MAERNPHHAIARLVERINDTWLNGSPDDLAECFHPDMVILHPDFADRTIGRDACVESYRQFAHSAAIRTFKSGTPFIDLFGATAIAAYEFEIAYELSGQLYRERGKDVFVFVQEDDAWLAVWRTVSYERLFPSSTG